MNKEEAFDKLQENWKEAINCECNLLHMNRTKITEYGLPAFRVMDLNGGEFLSCEKNVSGEKTYYLYTPISKDKITMINHQAIKALAELPADIEIEEIFWEKHESIIIRGGSEYGDGWELTIDEDTIDFNVRASGRYKTAEKGVIKALLKDYQNNRLKKWNYQQSVYENE